MLQRCRCAETAVKVREQYQCKQLCAWLSWSVSDLPAIEIAAACFSAVKLGGKAPV